MSKRVALFSNPKSGAGKSAEITARAVKRLRERGMQVDEYIGKDPADARRLGREVLDHGTDVVAAVGGDGMISHTLQQLSGTDVPLGIIPSGTGNDHARHYGIPRDNPEAAADLIADGHVTRVDVGLVQGAGGIRRYFGSIAAAGFDSLVTDRTNTMSWPRGRMRYNVALLAELANLKPLPFRMTLDDGTVIERDITLVAIGNTSSYGGGMRICPNADPTDGLLDVTVIDSGSRFAMIRSFPKVFSGKHIESPEVQTYRTTSIRIESPGITAYADGELIGELPVDVSVLPRHLSILTPKDRVRQS
ncbi:diacylglycerol kinase [Antrihabitans cavernicola]|uniref:Diacylglycerol kinase n=1 Tax=Antrihabitans cavernicola TaxID=2495913 RepID=A0A5A7SJR6_9NOCA|nr:diacylglycerol kinase [Spelaeibacter cavernicola]KAA0025007.1 diacylglycerol kinase [Spelaeibacter cavernicola]